MAANGPGVVMDASVPPVRITHCDDLHVDVQTDQVEALTSPRYDYSKIWATMGRANPANGVVRAGMVEEGDSFNGWQAGTIVAVVGGVPHLHGLGGTPYTDDHWNTLAAYNPWGGVDEDDFCIYGVIDSWFQLNVHLAAGVAAPSLAYEYWNGTVWAALTLYDTPDWTCAGGILNQRLRFQKPSAWAESTPAQIAIGAITNPGSYWRIRLRLTADYLAAAPQANVAYKDYMKGHWRKFFLAYDLKRGDDTATAYSTNFDDDGNFSLKFRDGRGLDGRTSANGSYYNHGSVDTQTTRHTLGKAWSIVAPGRRLTLWGLQGANGLIATIPRHKDVTTTGDFQIRRNGVHVDLYNVMLNGYAGGAGTFLGSGGTQAVRDLVNVRITPHPLMDDTVNSGGVINTFNVDAAGLVDKLILDIRRRTGGVKWLNGIRSAVSGALFDGIMLTDDDFAGGNTSGQLVATGGGVALFRNIDWGGPDLKVYAIAGEEFRYLRFAVRQDGTDTPVAGIPIRVTASDAASQSPGSEVTDANGRLELYIGQDWSGSVVGAHNQSLVKVSKWVSEVETITDEPMRIEVNPSDAAAYNPAYLSLDIRHRFPRRLVYDFGTSAFVLADWQRDDVELLIALPLAVVGGGPAVPVLYEDLPLEADSVERIEAEVPEFVD